jgi:hypothetical protein
MVDLRDMIHLIDSLLMVYAMASLLVAHRRLDKLEEKVAADIKRRELERLR